MAMEAVARGAPCLISKNAFLSITGASAAATTARVARPAGGNRGGVLLRSGRRERDEWDADAGCGRLVDEDMATLRRRIREARARAPPHSLPGPDDEEEGDDGLGGEESYAAGELLRALVARARPGLGAGVAALLLLGVPASVLVLSAQLIQVLNGR